MGKDLLTGATSIDSLVRYAVDDYLDRGLHPDDVTMVDARETARGALHVEHARNAIRDILGTTGAEPSHLLLVRDNRLAETAAYPRKLHIYVSKKTVGNYTLLIGREETLAAVMMLLQAHGLSVNRHPAIKDAYIVVQMLNFPKPT